MGGMAAAAAARTRPFVGAKGLGEKVKRGTATRDDTAASKKTGLKSWNVKV